MNEIKTGAWKITHQGIAFSTDMVLLDGQHRLIAIQTKSSVTITKLVTFGLESDSMSVIDALKLCVHLLIECAYLVKMTGNAG